MRIKEETEIIEGEVRCKSVCVLASTAPDVLWCCCLVSVPGAQRADEAAQRRHAFVQQT